MNTYSLTHFDLFDPALQLEAEELTGPLFVHDAIARHDAATDIHQKIVGVIASLEQLSRQLGATARQPKAEKRMQR